LVGAGALVGGASVNAQSSNSVKNQPNSIKTTNAEKQKVENNESEKPKIEVKKVQTPSSTSAPTKNIQTIKVNPPKSNVKEVGATNTKSNPAITQPQTKKSKLAELEAKYSLKNTEKTVKAEQNQTNEQNIKTVGELNQQNGGANNLKKDPKRETFDKVNKRFDELKNQTSKPTGKVDNYRSIKPNDLGNPERSTSTQVGKSILNVKKPSQQGVAFSNTGEPRVEFATLQIDNLNRGFQPDGIYKYDSQATTFYTGSTASKEVRKVNQETPVKIIDVSLGLNLYEKVVKNGNVSFQTLLQAETITIDGLTGESNQTTTNPALGVVSAETVQNIEKPGFDNNPETTFRLNIPGAGQQEIGKTTTITDNTVTTYRQFYSAGQTRLDLQVNDMGAVLEKNTRNFVIFPELKKGQEAILLANIFGQLLPTFNYVLEPSGKAHPNLLNTDLFLQKVYLGGNPEMNIANTSLSFSDPIKDPRRKQRGIRYSNRTVCFRI